MHIHTHTHITLATLESAKTSGPSGPSGPVMSEIICRRDDCNNHQPLESLRIHPNNSNQQGGICPSCKKFSWTPLEKNERKASY
jgi:hypothetical protein